MLTAFYLSGTVAIAATLMMVTQLEAINALLYLVVSLLAVAVVFFTLGAPFVAALEVITYAGAIMVLFLFVVMMLNVGARAVEAERRLFSARALPGPLALAGVLLIELVYLLAGTARVEAAGATPREVAMSLFGPYAVGVELASLLLLGALVGAAHLGSPSTPLGVSGGGVDGGGTR